MLLLLLALALADPRPVELNSTLEGATIQLSADKRWSLYPGDCLDIAWQVEGIESIYIDGQGKIGWGEMDYCPPWDGPGPVFRITAQNGAVDTFTLDLNFGPDELLICFFVVAILALFLLAGYYLYCNNMNTPLPVAWSKLLLFAIVIVASLLLSASGTLDFRQIVRGATGVFASPAWHFFGVALGALVFSPLLIGKLRHGIRTGATADFVAIVAFLLFLLMLYLPFGFEYIDLWENWVFQAYLEGRPSRASSELVSRFWLLVPISLSRVISPDSFMGFHIVHALTFFGKMALLYGLLRHLRIPPYIGFLCTVLFFTYPVNSGLMMLRSNTHTFSSLALFVSAYLALTYRSNPSRWQLLGIWLALLYNIGSYESGYALILVVPALWWFGSTPLRYRLNLSVAWYLFPAMKAIYLLLITISGIDFYRSNSLGSSLLGGRSLLDWLSHHLGILGDVYRQTFVAGWQEALNAISQNLWIAPTVSALSITGIAAIYLARDSNAGELPSRRKAAVTALCGLLFVLPSIGVLMWFERYNQDLWRMYVYVPIGAAVAVVCLLTLVSSLSRDPRIRKLIIGAACLTLMFPATSRLIVQHAHFHNSANAKASVLRQVVEQAPATDEDTFVILLTDMTGSELQARGVSELRTNMLDGSMYVLYSGKGPQVTFLCMIGVWCFPDDVELKNFSLDENTDFSNLVLFRLHEDLSVELLRELPPELGLDDRGTYDPDRLIDFSAPLPPRAVTMLGAAVRSI